MSQLLLTTHGPAAAATAAARTKTTPPIVMIVDDHADTREMLRYVIELSGCLVVEAADGEEAVQLAKCISPNMILMDTTLPNLDGYGATERIRNLGSDRKVTIIFLSGNAGPQARDRAFAAGGDDYFLKPIDLKKLALALTKYLLIPASAAS